MSEWYSSPAVWSGIATAISVLAAGMSAYVLIAERGARIRREARADLRARAWWQDQERDSVVIEVRNEGPAPAYEFQVYPRSPLAGGGQQNLFMFDGPDEGYREVLAPDTACTVAAHGAGGRVYEFGLIAVDLSWTEKIGKRKQEPKSICFDLEVSATRPGTDRLRNPRQLAKTPR